MSNHEITLALIDEKLERLEIDRKAQTGVVFNTKATLEKQENELKLIMYSIKELENSKAALEFDRINAKAGV